VLFLGDVTTAGMDRLMCGALTLKRWPAATGMLLMALSSGCVWAATPPVQTRAGPLQLARMAALSNYAYVESHTLVAVTTTLHAWANAAAPYPATTLPDDQSVRVDDNYQVVSSAQPGSAIIQYQGREWTISDGHLLPSVTTGARQRLIDTPQYWAPISSLPMPTRARW
jgi:hypothetical protein